MGNIYKRLIEGGAYSLPYLIHLYDEDKTVNLYLINDNKDCVYNGNTYKASSFTYQLNFEGGATLEVSLVDNDTLIDLFENNYSFKAEIIGVMLEDTVEEIITDSHRYGSATWDGSSATITFEKDDRLEMTFPALIFNSYNNRGNT